MRTAQDILNDALELNARSTMATASEIHKLAQENEDLVNSYHQKELPYSHEDKEQLGVAVQTFKALLRYCQTPLHMVKMTYMSGLACQLQGKNQGMGEAVDQYEKALDLIKYYASLHPEIMNHIPESLIQERLKEIFPSQSKSATANNTGVSVGHFPDTSTQLMADLFKSHTPSIQKNPLMPLEIAPSNLSSK